MKRTASMIAAAMLVIGISETSYAGDQEWSDAGKVLAVMEGLRVITGGSVDIIGGVTGVNRDSGSEVRQRSVQRNGSRQYARSRYERCSRPQKIWVPHYETRREYVPRHQEYRPGKGTVVVDGHYVEYQVEHGGHWEYVRRSMPHAGKRSF